MVKALIEPGITAERLQEVLNEQISPDTFLCRQNGWKQAQRIIEIEMRPGIDTIGWFEVGYLCYAINRDVHSYKRQIPEQ